MRFLGAAKDAPLGMTWSGLSGSNSSTYVIPSGGCRSRGIPATVRTPPDVREYRLSASLPLQKIDKPEPAQEVRVSDTRTLLELPRPS